MNGLTTGELDQAGLDIDPLDLFGDQRHPSRQLGLGWFEKLTWLVSPERHKQQTWLVEMKRGRLDHRDVPLLWRKQWSKLVDDHRSSGAGTQNQEAFHRHLARITPS